MKFVRSICPLCCSTILMASLALAPHTFGQTAAAPQLPQPEFEAVSIHMIDPHAPVDPSRDSGGLSMSNFPTNHFTLNHAPLTFLIQFAYNIDSQEHISGMPAWMDAQEYDFSAKVEGDQQLTLEQMRPMLQRLIEQRFHFAAHHETKMLPGFALIVAKGGPKLKPSNSDGKPHAQMLQNRVDVANLNATHIAGILAHHAGRPVVDKTGLTGSYDFTLSYAAINDTNSNLPEFFTAVREQLGLKLEPQKVPVDFLVIDHVDKIPTEN